MPVWEAAGKAGGGQGASAGTRIFSARRLTCSGATPPKAPRLQCRLFGNRAIPGTGRDDVLDWKFPCKSYFKVGKDDPRAVAVSGVVHGQPNIYALFMAVGAALLRVGGDFVFITPRSFSSGLYFRRFRAVFFDMIRPTRIHVFGSRRDAFRRDEVLQENVIFSGIRQDRWHGNGAGAPIAISSSFGVGDINESSAREVSASVALDFASMDKILRLPTCDNDDDALALVDSWSGSLCGLGLNISTGPVVPFRATEFIAREGNIPASHAPLLWMNHVRAMRATWPLDRHKPEYIERSGAEALLVPNRNYVLLRRFSAKEEARRLTAPPGSRRTSRFPRSGWKTISTTFTVPEAHSRKMKLGDSRRSTTAAFSILGFGRSTATRKSAPPSYAPCRFPRMRRSSHSAGWRNILPTPWRIWMRLSRAWSPLPR